MSHARKWALVACLVSVVTAPAISAWACVPYGPAIKLDRERAATGETVTLRGTGFSRTEPVIVRLNNLQGPVLATLTATGGAVNGTFTVPDTAPGEYVILVDHEEPLGRVLFQPVRAALTITKPDGAVPVIGAVPPERARIPDLATKGDGLNAGLVAIVALGVGGTAFLAVGLAALFLSRRPAPAAVREVTR